MRAFIAVDLSEEIRNRIASLEADFAQLGLQGTVKSVDPRLAHQTVKFLGEVPDEDVEQITAALAGIRQNPFEIELRGVGFFPKASLEKARNIRVIWVGMRSGQVQLKALQKEVESAMYALGYPLERRFSAHVTLCRVKRPFRSKSELKRVLTKIGELHDAEVGKMRVDELKLKKSTLTPKGPYTRICM